MNERNQQIEAALRDLLEDGDRLVVSRSGDRIAVAEHDPSESSSLAAHDAEFYGYCATLTSQLDSATGCGYMVLWIAITLGGCFALDVYAPDFAGWKVYITIIGVCLWAWNASDDVFTMRVYRSKRDELRDRLHRAGLSRELAIGLMGDDGEVDTLAKYLKKDDALDY